MSTHAGPCPALTRISDVLSVSMGADGSAVGTGCSEGLTDSRPPALSNGGSGASADVGESVGSNVGKGVGSNVGEGVRPDVGKGDGVMEERGEGDGMIPVSPSSCPSFPLS